MFLQEPHFYVHSSANQFTDLKLAELWSPIAIGRPEAAKIKGTSGNDARAYLGLNTTSITTQLHHLRKIFFILLTTLCLTFSTSYVQWVTTGGANGINKNQINLDFANAVIFKFLKYIQFRIATHVLYDPLYSTRLQFQNDFTLGFVLEGKKKVSYW